MPFQIPNPIYNQEQKMKAFDDSKAGVKGLVDSSLKTVHRFFFHENPLNRNIKTSTRNVHEIPLIDFHDIVDNNARREVVVSQVKYACEKYGFFQVINHGIRIRVLDEMLDGIRRFHEQDVDVKKEYYSRDYETKRFLYNSNFSLFQTKAAAWRDTLTFIRGSSPPNPQELAPICRGIMIHYTNELMKLGETIYELLSEALGLNPDYLKSIGCSDAIYATCNYYPPCPEPELTIGSTTHADSGFITVVNQSHQIPGLQVLYQDQWIDVLPIPGALVVNMGNLMQLVSNNKFVSALYKVLVSKEGPRISMASIFRAHNKSENIARIYEPIHELLSDENPALYRAVTVKEIISVKHVLPPGAIANVLDHFKL